MKVANVVGLLVAIFAALNFAKVFEDGARDKVIQALAARDLSVDEINDIFNLMPRQDPSTVIVTSYPAACSPYGIPPASTPVPPATTQITVTSSTTSTVTQTSTSLISTETPVETPSVPVPATTATPTIETTSAPLPSTSVESSVPTTPVPNTPTPSSEGSSIVETTSSIITHTSVSTATSTHTTATPAISSGIPPAPSNGASSAGVDLGLVGLVAMLALV